MPTLSDAEPVSIRLTTADRLRAAYLRDRLGLPTVTAVVRYALVRVTRQIEQELHEDQAHQNQAQ